MFIKKTFLKIKTPPGWYLNGNPLTMRLSLKRRRRNHELRHHELGKIRNLLRLVQNKSGCATSTLDLVLKYLHPFLKGCEDLKHCEMKMTNIVKKQSLRKRQLHGCVRCNGHVFGPTCAATQCPKCNFPRYNEKGFPNEVLSSYSTFFLISAFSLLFCFCPLL